MNSEPDFDGTKPNPSEEGVEVKEGEISPIELPQIDVSSYVGQKAKIVTIKKIKSKFKTPDGKDSWYLRIATEPIGEFEISATKLLGLHQNEEGKFGHSPETKLGIYLKKKNVDDPAKLKNMEVILQTQTGKDGRDYLTFN